MSIIVDVINALKSHSGLSALVGSRIYRARLPQGVAYPSILCRFSYEPVNSLSSPSNKNNATVEFEVYASSLAAAEQIQEQIESALSVFKFVVIDIRDDDFLDQNNMYSVFSEYSIWS